MQSSVGRIRRVMFIVTACAAVAVLVAGWRVGESHRLNCVHHGKVGCSVLPWVGGHQPTISPADAASNIEQSVLRERHLHVKVTCVPGPLQEKHKTFKCTARLRDGRNVPFVYVVRPPNEYVQYGTAK